jgi:hypothetical protein
LVSQRPLRPLQAIQPPTLALLLPFVAVVDDLVVLVSVASSKQGRQEAVREA